MSACLKSNVKFDKLGWNTYGDGIPCPPLRERMLEDLLKNHKLIGLSYRQLIDKLGEPPKCDICESNRISYEIVVDYGYDIDPVFIKTLDFYYNKDSLITDWTINEIKH